MYHIRNLDTCQQHLRSYPEFDAAQTECDRRNRMSVDGEWIVCESIEGRPFFKPASKPALKTDEGAA